VLHFLYSLANESDSGRKESDDCPDKMQMEISKTVLFTATLLRDVKIIWTPIFVPSLCAAKLYSYQNKDKK
jgi:hypothetical protein